MPLPLTINKEFFDLIASGKKTIEYRDASQFYISRFCTKNEKGEPLDIKPIEAIEFINGYRKDARRMVVEIKKIDIIEDTDEEGNILVDEHDEPYWLFAIHLGKVIKKP